MTKRLPLIAFCTALAVIFGCGPTGEEKNAGSQDRQQASSQGKGESNGEDKPAGGEQGEKTMPLEQYLLDVGRLYDCYFTVEEAHKGGGSSNVIFSTRVSPNLDHATLDEVLCNLREALPDVQIVQGENNRVVIHLISGQLKGKPDYGLDARLDSFSYSGAVMGMADELSKRVPTVKAQTTFGVGNGPIRADYATTVTVVAKDCCVRDALTNYVPLSAYDRVLWTAETELEDDGETTICFRGPARTQSKGVGDGDHVIDFSLGETAYYANARDSTKAISSAIEYVKAVDQKRSGCQVRWAMRYLGDAGAVSAVLLLVENLSYRYATCGVLEESYPAVYALRRIGEPAVSLILEKIPSEGDEVRRGLMCEVIRAVKGKDQGRAAVQQLLDAQKTENRNIQEALKFFDRD